MNSEVAPDKKNGFLLPTDMLYLGTFMLGMAAFWLSGHAGPYIPRIGGANFAALFQLGVTALIYGLIMLVFGAVVLRRIVPALVAALVATVLGAIAARVVILLAANLVHTRPQLAILTFVLYFLYGSIYMLSLAVGRKLAKPRATIA